MRDTPVTRSYASALFELGERHKLHDEFVASFNELEDVLAENPQMRAFLGTPKIPPAAKKTALRKALDGRAHALFVNFLMILVDKRRQRMLVEVGRDYRHLLDERLGRLHVQVTVAREPDDQMRKELTDQLSRSLGREVIPHIGVNQDILGGVIVRFGDRVLDGSLRRRMLSMRRRLLDAGLPNR